MKRTISISMVLSIAACGLIFGSQAANAAEPGSLTGGDQAISVSASAVDPSSVPADTSSSDGSSASGAAIDVSLPADVATLDAATSQIAAIIQGQSLGASVVPNYETSTVEVQYESSVAFESFAAMVASVIGADVQVVFTPVESVAVIEQSLQGGDGTLPGTSTCSSGYIAFQGSSYGITTAGHCPGMVLYHGGQYYSITDQATPVGDLRWYQLGVMSTASPMVRSDATPMVYVTSNSPLVVQGVQTVTAAAVGEAICFHGIVTNQTCTTLYRINFSSNLYSGLMVAANGVTQLGDSGGVWYRYVSGGVEAIGIHSGTVVIGGVTRSVFTPVTVLSSIGVSVYTAQN